MSIQDTDRILINRSGDSFQVQAQNFDSVQDTDLLLVNRAGASFKCTRANLDSKVQDDDTLLINRAGTSYRCSGAEFKNILSNVFQTSNITALQNVFPTSPPTEKWQLYTPLTDAGAVITSSNAKCLAVGPTGRSLTFFNKNSSQIKGWKFSDDYFQTDTNDYIPVDTDGNSIYFSDGVKSALEQCK